jgi:hypothetical protein
MTRRTRQLRTLSPADLRGVLGGGSITLTASPPPPAAGELPTETISMNYSPIRL